MFQSPPSSSSYFPQIIPSCFCQELLGKWSRTSPAMRRLRLEAAAEAPWAYGKLPSQEIQISMGSISVHIEFVNVCIYIYIMSVLV